TRRTAPPPPPPSGAGVSEVVVQPPSEDQAETAEADVVPPPSGESDAAPPPRNAADGDQDHAVDTRGGRADSAVAASDAGQPSAVTVPGQGRAGDTPQPSPDGPAAQEAGQGQDGAPSRIDTPDAGEQTAAAPGSGAFQVRLANFEGPFDLLLQLISKHKLDVTE